MSDRQAALLLLMPVQQGLTTPAALQEARGLCLGRRRRGFARQVVADIARGIQVVADIARGIQVLREGPRGRIYLPVRWDDHRLVVEIDGVQHRRGSK